MDAEATLSSPLLPPQAISVASGNASAHVNTDLMDCPANALAEWRVRSDVFMLTIIRKQASLGLTEA